MNIDLSTLAYFIASIVAYSFTLHRSYPCTTWSASVKPVPKNAGTVINLIWVVYQLKLVLVFFLRNFCLLNCLKICTETIGYFK